MIRKRDKMILIARNKHWIRDQRPRKCINVKKNKFWGHMKVTIACKFI